MADFKRTDRVAENIQRILARLIQQEIQEPKLSGLVTISNVTVTRDFEHAKVYFTVFNGDPDETQEILNSVSGYLRSVLARTMTLRTVPHLQFFYDRSIEYGNRLSRLIDEVNLPDENNETTD